MEIVTHNTPQKNFFYPPGGILIWIIILLEVITFGIALIGFFLFGSENREMFTRSASMLNPTLGTLNTIVLLSSGFFMALSTSFFKSQQISKALNYILYAMIGGLIFIGVKIFEYQHKISLGIGLEENMFFTFYWSLTFFHLVHVLVAMVILFAFFIKLRKSKVAISDEDFTAGAAFWHMCDLIWLLLFPALYLIY
jgi:nitric oxide reductase NorE protein